MKNEGYRTSKIEGQTRKIPSALFLGFAFGSVVVSALLALSGRKQAANFVGQWVPTILILGTYNKLAKTFSAPYQQEEGGQYGRGVSPGMEAGAGYRSEASPRMTT